MTALMGGSGAGRNQVCMLPLLHGRQALMVLREAARKCSRCASRLPAGKTTLMDVIAGRKTQGIIEGDILVNGAMSCRTCATETFYVHLCPSQRLQRCPLTSVPHGAAGHPKVQATWSRAIGYVEQSCVVFVPTASALKCLVSTMGTLLSLAATLSLRVAQQQSQSFSRACAENAS